MAIIYTETVKNIVQEAFNLMRQDFSAPSYTDSDIDTVADTSFEWLKAKLSIHTAANEVFDAFDWGDSYTAEGLSSWPYKMRNALVYTLARELAIPIGGRVEDMKVFASLANEKLQQAILRSLHEKLASNQDGVLTEVLCNFKGDDPGLVRTYTIYTQRAATVKATAEAEINMAHSWRTAFDWDGSTASAHPAYPAWVLLCASKLAIPCGYGADTAQLLEQKYQARLQTARCADLEAAKDAITDTDTKDILAQILGSFSPADAKLPRSIASITARITSLSDNARQDVLLAHDWNFACVNEEVTGAPCDQADDGYVWHYPYPSRALRLIAVYGVRGQLGEWKVENSEIRALEPITKIKYMRDVTDLTKWSAIVRPLYTMRLKALVSRSVMGNPNDAALQEQSYAQALAQAKLNDTRESNHPDDVWGPNHYAERMRGNKDAFSRDTPFRR